MIHLLLKHKILEYSIDIIFKNINSNFKSLPDISTGNKFKSIGVKYKSVSNIPDIEYYYNCEITSVLTSIYLNRKVKLFSFSHAGGSDMLSFSEDNLIFYR